MEVLSQKLNNAGPSSCRSLGSNQYHSGRSSKVSIGIAVDKFPRLDSRANNGDATSLLTCEKRYASHEKIIHGSSEPVTIESNRCKVTPKYQRSSTKLSTNLFGNGTATTDTGHAFAQKPPISHLGGIGDELTAPSEGGDTGKAQKPSALNSIKSMISEALNQQTVHVVANQTLQTGKPVSSHKKIVSDMELEKGAYADDHDIAFTTEEDVHAPAKSVTREQSDRETKTKSEILRMKLWEVLGTSQNKQTFCSPDHKIPSSFFENEGGEVEKNVTKAKQSSDTIETDSESPHQSVKRPVTRSITRKKEKAPAKINKMLPTSSNKKIPLASSSSASKLKLEDRNIFTFVEEAKAVRSGQVCNGLTNSFHEKRSKQRKARIEPRRINFSIKSTSEKVFQTTVKEETAALHNKATPESHGAEKNPLVSQLEKNNLVTPAPNEVSNANNHSQKEVKGFHHKMVESNQECHKLSGRFGRKSHSLDQSKSRAQKNCCLPKEVDTPSVAKSATPFIDFDSPTFALNTTKPSRESKLRDEVISPMVSHKRTSLSRAYISNFVEDYTATRQNEDAYIESSEETRDIDGLLDTSCCDVEEKGTERCASLSSKEEQKSEGFEANDFLNRGFTSPKNCLYDDNDSLKESPFISLTPKRLHNLKDDTTSQINLSTSPLDCTTRTEETTVHNTLDQFAEDSLARAVYQLAIFLQKIKKKMKSQTNKKSSEIVLAAAEQVHLQTQEVKSKIDEDLGKFINFGKSKRRRLETKFEEQSEMLRAMHAKFKEELKQHLLDCSSTLEEIETQNKELKGCADKQKASHEKLLLQIKEAIEYQLSDAETKIAQLHEEANRKMGGLRRALREWMVEDTI